jgi:hypothetical protein
MFQETSRAHGGGEGDPRRRAAAASILRVGGADRPARRSAGSLRESTRIGSQALRRERRRMPDGASRVPPDRCPFGSFVTSSASSVVDATQVKAGSERSPVTCPSGRSRAGHHDRRQDPAPRLPAPRRDSAVPDAGFIRRPSARRHDQLMMLVGGALGGRSGLIRLLGRGHELLLVLVLRKIVLAMCRAKPVLRSRRPASGIVGGSRDAAGMPMPSSTSSTSLQRTPSRRGVNHAAVVVTARASCNS